MSRPVNTPGNRFYVALSLLLKGGTVHTGEYEALVPVAVHVLSLMVHKGSCGPDYRTPSPWLQIKFLKFL